MEGVYNSGGYNSGDYNRDSTVYTFAFTELQ